MADHPWIAQYDAGVPASLEPYPNNTLLESIDVAVAERPAAPALLFKGRAMSWGELATLSDAFASALAALGVRRGDRVAAVLPNCPQFFIVELAVWKLGGVLVPLNPIYTAEEMEGPLRTTGARVIITLTTFYERVKDAQKRTSLQHVVLTSIKEYLPPITRLLFTIALEKKGGHRATPRDGDPTLPALLKAHAGRRPTAPRPSPDDDALLLMSGGTTGVPKAVRVHHGGLVRTGMQLRAWLKAVLPEWEGVYCMPLPMFHSYGACGVQAVCFIGHNPIALIPNPRDFDDVVRTIERTRPAVFCAVPTLYNALLAHRRVAAGKVDFRSIKACVSGAAPLHAETHRRFTEITGARVIEGYALTESILAATLWPLQGRTKVGSVGVPLPDCRVRIVDADDPTRELPAGEVGEILLTGPQIMRGYFNAPEGTDPMLSPHADGTSWLHTADLGRLDDEGSLYVVDRKKDLIKMGGMQVWPREIEEVLAKHPAVQEVGVRGFPDEKRGEIAVAFVVLRAGMTAATEDLRAWCKTHLAPYKVPARVELRSDLPKSMIGKVLRRLLVSMLVAVMACVPGTRPAAADTAMQRANAQRPRLLLVSLDGFRADYVDRPGAVNLRRLAARGVRAERMIPAFPSKTFPNHYTLVTGLTPEHHGIVANVIRDAELGTFRTSDSLAIWESRWWGGEPIWVTAELQGQRAAAYFWPGSEAAIKGVRPTWYERYEHARPHDVRVRQVLEWLAMPIDSAPTMITLYFAETDDAGHRYGPFAAQTDLAITRVDSAVGALMDGIDRLGLRDVVNLVVVSDHGMAPSSHERLIRIDDYLPRSSVEVVDWTPVASIVPTDGDAERVYSALKGRHPHLQVYRKGEVPARLHFNDNPRIAPIVAIADEGWTITDREGVARYEGAMFDGGQHGYDPELLSMGALFVGAGPGIAVDRRVPAFRNVHLYPLMAHLLGLRAAASDGSLDSVRTILRSR